MSSYKERFESKIKEAFKNRLDIANEDYKKLKEKKDLFLIKDMKMNNIRNYFDQLNYILNHDFINSNFDLEDIVKAHLSKIKKEYQQAYEILKMNQKDIYIYEMIEIKSKKAFCKNVKALMRLARFRADCIY